MRKEWRPGEQGGELVRPEPRKAVTCILFFYLSPIDQSETYSAENASSTLPGRPLLTPTYPEPT
jgi:hypothetical protein